MAKYVIVGGVAGGASTAARLRRLDEYAEIIMLEKGEHVSFSNCCLPYHLSGVVKKLENLVLMSPETFWKQYRIEARVNSEVTAIDRANKSVTVKDPDGKEYSETYDKLILSPGIKASIPPVTDVDQIPHFVLKNVTNLRNIVEAIQQHQVKEITVVGASFIGLEVAENLHDAGFNVTIVEFAPQVLPIAIDDEMAQVVHKEIHDRGISLHLDKKLEKCTAKSVILSDGQEIKADLVIFAAGGRPASDIAKNAGLPLTESGAICTDRNYQTVDPDIYAVGDAIQVYNAISESPAPVALAGPAQKQAYSVANHIYGRPVVNNGYIASSILQVFDLCIGSTGLNERTLQKLGKSYNFAYVLPNDKVGLMPGVKPVHFKILFDSVTGKLYGAQSLSHGNADKRIDVFATCLKFGGSVSDLKDLELAYAPPYGTAKDVVNFAGYVGENLLNRVFQQVPVSQVRSLVEQKACVIDVREKLEYASGHIKGALNIPLSQLRDRLDEIPKDRDIYVHCRSSQRSYNALLALQQRGFDRVWNISGSYLALSYYEYYRDQVTGRESILTEYNFN